MSTVLSELTAAQVAEIIIGHHYTYEIEPYAHDDKGKLIKDAFGKYKKLPTETRAATIDSWDEVEDWIGKEGKFIEGLGALRFIESFGGEGQGDSMWFVFSVTAGDTTRLFRMDGWYASHVGGEYDGELAEVKPVDRIVTFYE